MPASANWSFPTAVRFGAGRIAELPDACRAAGIARPLLVTDPGLAKLPMTQAMLESLEAAGLAAGLFSDVKPNPVEANLKAGIETFRAGGHDGVICVGGGSALDLGKLVAFMEGQTKPVWDFEDIGDLWKAANHDAVHPIVCVPTTAGTGSEVGRAGVLTNEGTHTKKVIFHPGMLAKIVICDPELTVGLPRILTVGTGMDALAHCIEAYCAPSYHPMAAGIAVEGIRLVKEALPRVASDGGDIEARADMMSAAAMGAVAFQKGLGAIHALSHPIGALYDTHHGMTNAVMMPYVLAFNRREIEEKMGRLAAWLGLESGFEGVMGWVMTLRAELDVPPTLKEFGVDDARLDRIAAMAVVDPTAGGNPVELTEDGAKTLFRMAYEGRLEP